jgi:hypothetical protein
MERSANFNIYCLKNLSITWLPFVGSYRTFLVSAAEELGTLWEFVGLCA